MQSAEELKDWPTICGRTTEGRTVAFKVSAYLCGNKDCAICNRIWEAIWAAPTEHGRANAYGTEAVGRGGNESGNVVQAKKANCGRPRIENREVTFKATKPWEKLGMSERTWYRRRAEKLKANQGF